MKKIISLLALFSMLGVGVSVAEDANTKLQELQKALALKPDDATLLNNTAIALYDAGNYAEAEPLIQRMLVIYEKTLGKDHPWVVKILTTLARLYYLQGKYDLAEPLFQRTLAIQEKVLGKDQPDIATSLNDLGALYNVQGKYEQAEPLLQRSLAIKEKALGKDHPDVALSLYNLASLYDDKGKYQQAETLYQRSLAIREKALGKGNPDVAQSLNGLAVLYKKQGKYEQADPLFQRSLAIREKALGKNHPAVAESLNNLATLYDDQGKYEQAQSLYLRSLAIREKALGKDHPTVATSLNNLAMLYSTQGKYDQAEPLLQRSLTIYEKVLGKDHSAVADSLNNLAELYYAQGKYDQANPLYLRSLAIREKALGKDHPDVAQSLNNLAELYYAQGKYEQVESLYIRSLAIWEKALGKDQPDVAYSLNNLAMFYSTQGKYDQAEPLFQRSLAIFENALGEDHPNAAQILNNLANLYDNKGKYDQAEPLYQRSLAIWEKALGKDHPKVALSLNNLAEHYGVQGKYDQAEPLYQKSLRLTNQSLERWLWGAGERTRQSYLQQREGERNTYLSFYSLRNTPEEAFYFSLSRKGLLLQVASEVSSLAKQSSDPAIQKQVLEFNALRTQLSNLAFSVKADKSSIQDLEDKSNTLERQLSQQVSGFKRSQTEVTPEQVLEKLSNEETVIDFLIYTEFDFISRKPKTEQIIALVAGKKDGIQLIKLGELAPIAAAIKTYQTTIVPTKNNANSREQTLKQTAQILYTQLWQPLMPYLQDKKTVYLISDGVLHLLPFKALQDKDGHYLAESVQLITLSSARDIVLPALTAKASTTVIFAAPDYGNETPIHSESTTRAIDLKNIYFSQLASALNEGQQIDKLFLKKQPESPTKLFLKDKATEQAVTASTSPKILHLATHGFFLEDSKPDEKALTQSLMRGLDQDLPLGKIDNPLTRSGLAFAGANSGVKGIKQADGTDGILTALEVLNLNLEGTYLVTLSACDTGTGDIKIGEGVYSLNRAFQEAGAKAVLSTLWSVDDQATAEFMQKFYERFLDGKPAQQAIQETQTEFMHHEKYSNPFYWAGFVMMGKD